MPQAQASSLPWSIAQNRLPATGQPHFLAPLAGVTNLPFRLLAREAGCGLVCTEMISADGLAHGSAHTFYFLRSLPAENRSPRKSSAPTRP
jgi:tRNA-dihydrouridine synthase